PISNRLLFRAYRIRRPVMVLFELPCHTRMRIPNEEGIFKGYGLRQDDSFQSSGSVDASIVFDYLSFKKKKERIGFILVSFQDYGCFKIRLWVFPGPWIPKDEDRYYQDW